MNMKKLISMVLALVMLLAMSATAFAADATYTITIDNTAAGHTYEAYQIFSGTLMIDETDDKSYLGNIAWGTGVDLTKLSEAQKADAAKVATELDDSNAAAFAADMAKKLSTTCATSTYDENDKQYTISNLKPGYYLVKDQDKSLDGKDDAYTSFILVVVKNETVSPKSDAPTFEKKVKDTNDTTNETSGWQDSADYDIGDDVPFQLKATLADNVSAYKTYKVVFHDTLSSGLTYNGDAKVYVGEGDSRVDVTEEFTINHAGGTLTISCNDVKEFAGNKDVIVVEYTAKLNDDAVIGSEGNPNTANLEFSNNPNYDGTGVESTGKTPDDTVIVFTYKVVVNKVDENKAPLQGAGFTLYKKNASGEYVAIGEELTGDALTTFEWKGLDDGDYKLVETTTPAGYNTIVPIEFKITATHDVTSDNPTLTALTGGNMFTGEVSTGTLTGDVVNEKGATLPETGAQGTKMIYMVGGILVAAAAILLITKRRMDAAE